MTPSVRGCLARSAHKPLTAWVKPPMLTRMSARCFAPLRFVPAVHRAALGPLGPEVRDALTSGGVPCGPR